MNPLLCPYTDVQAEVNKILCRFSSVGVTLAGEDCNLGRYGRRVKEKRRELIAKEAGIAITVSYYFNTGKL